MAFSVSNHFGFVIRILVLTDMAGLLIATLAFSAGVLADMANSSAIFRIKNYLILVAAPVIVPRRESPDPVSSRH